MPGAPAMVGGITFRSPHEPVLRKSDHNLSSFLEPADFPVIFVSDHINGTIRLLRNVADAVPEPLAGDAPRAPPCRPQAASGDERRGRQAPDKCL